MMQNYKEVKTQTDMDQLLNSIAGFHDGMTKEFHIINRGSIDADKKSMDMSHQFDGRFLIQSQWEPYGLELLFENISSLQISGSGEYWGASGIVDTIASPVNEPIITMKFDASLSITANRLFYRERREWLGADAFFGTEIPSSDMVKSIQLEGNWRQCSNCADAWEEELDVQISRCPSCQLLTEL